MAGRTIVITGCSSGIGAHCARKLLADGFIVIASARRQNDIEQLKKSGVIAHYLDYAEPESIDRFYNFALEQSGGQIDALFHNGGYLQPGAVEDLSTAALRAQFEANFFGWHTLTQLVLKTMRPQNSGQIICMSSILGVIPCRWLGAYNASKHALEGLMLSMSLELHDTDINVSLIESGAIASDIAKNAMPFIFKNIDIVHSRYRDDYKKQIPNLKNTDTVGRGRVDPNEVYKVLKKILNAKKPKRHYRVTNLAKLVELAKRILPSELLYKVIVWKN